MRATLIEFFTPEVGEDILNKCGMLIENPRVTFMSDGPDHGLNLYVPKLLEHVRNTQVRRPSHKCRREVGQKTSKWFVTGAYSPSKDT